VTYVVRMSSVDWEDHAFDPDQGARTEPEGERDLVAACGHTAPADQVIDTPETTPGCLSCAITFGMWTADQQDRSRGGFRDLVDRPWEDGGSS
jgi:hypothetical protein